MNKISYIKNIKVIDNGTNKVVLKRESPSIKEIYQLLDNRRFEYYLNPLKREKEYEVYPFIKEIDITKDDKSIDLIYLLSILHTKTTSYEEISIDEIKKIYEETIDNINNSFSFYLKTIISLEIFLIFHITFQNLKLT